MIIYIKFSKSKFQKVLITRRIPVKTPQEYHKTDVNRIGKPWTSVILEKIGIKVSRISEVGRLK